MSLSRLVLFIIPLILVVPSIAEAAPIHIGVNLSESCKIMIRNGFDTECPTPQKIMSFHPDTTDPMFSGKFEIHDNLLERQKPPVQNPIRYYDHQSENMVWYDPPLNVVDRIKLITIESSLPEYKLPTSYQMDNYTIHTGHDIWVSPDCKKASVSADVWPVQLGRVMQYMHHDCNEKYKTFENVKSTSFQKTVFDISTSYKWQLDEWIKSSKVKCLTICKEY